MLIGSTLSDALVAGLLLAYPRVARSAAPATRSGWVGSSSSRWRPRCFFVAKVPLLTASGVHLFGLMHLIYLDLVGVIPAVGLSLLAAARLAAARGSGR